MLQVPLAAADDSPSVELNLRQRALDLGIDPLAVQETVYDSVERLTLDERPAEDFFSEPRIGVAHTDEAFTRRLTELYRRVLAPLSGASAVVLDLCSSSSSHLPADLRLGQVVGHGVNEAELEANSALTSRFVQDLNRRSVLPLEPGTVGAVLCCNGVQYLTRPEWIAAEVFRVLRPGGVLVVAFSNSCWAERAAAGWLSRTAEQRLQLVRRVLENAGLRVLEVIRDESSPAPHANGRVHPTSNGDVAPAGNGNYHDRGEGGGGSPGAASRGGAVAAAGGGVTSDPLYAVVAERPGGVSGWEGAIQEPSPEQVAATFVGPALRELDLRPANATLATPLMLERWRASHSILVEDAATLGIPRRCAATLLELFRSARQPASVFAGVVSYTDPRVTSPEERCESPDLAPYEYNIRRMQLDSRTARGPTLSRFHGAKMYGRQKFLIQIDSHMRFIPGWDSELVRMARAAPPGRKVVFTHYPPSWDTPAESKVPVMCLAKWLPEGVLTFEAALLDAPAPNTFRPVPFVAGGFMFAPAAVMREVPFDPSLDFLFHGEEELYSARLWTSGWQALTPDRNVAFHHYGREDAPKFWNDFGSDPAYQAAMQASQRKVVALMNGTYGGSYKYGMGRQRSVEKWWKYAGLDPNDQTRGADGRRFCYNPQHLYGADAPLPLTPPRRWGAWFS